MLPKSQIKHSLEVIVGHIHFQNTFMLNNMEAMQGISKDQTNTLPRKHGDTMLPRLPQQRNTIPPMLPEPVFSQEALILLMKYILLAMTVIYAMQGDMGIAEFLRQIAAGM